MNDKQQTAVQWLMMRIRERQTLSEPGSRPNFTALFDKALAMEREQMIDFGNNCVEHYHTDWDTDLDDFTTIAEHLFTDTYHTEP